MADNHQQVHADAYRLPALDTPFLLGDSMRGVRFLLEYAKAEERLRAWGIASTIVVFGSARVRTADGDPSAPAAPPPPGAAPRPNAHAARWYDEARRLGRIVSERGGALTPLGGLRHNVIATGGGPGIMEAANRGASDAGAPSVGFNISLPHEQEPNSYSTPDLTFQFHYFAMRKMHLAMRARALLVFPGGFGTFDELFEMLTLQQSRKAPPIPILCFDQRYWTRMVNFEALAEEKMISPADLGLFGFVESAEEAWSELLRRGLEVPSQRTVAQDLPEG
jgi:uncharacterized protein (TIGR00730 family)